MVILNPVESIQPTALHRYLWEEELARSSWFFWICLYNTLNRFRWSLQIFWQFPHVIWRECCTLPLIWQEMLWMHWVFWKDVLSYPHCSLIRNVFQSMRI